MRISLINPYGPLPGEGWRDYRFTMIAEALADRGHRVTWWTSGFDHWTKRHRSRDWHERKVTDSFSINLVPTPGYRANIGFGRIRFEMAFALRMRAALLKTERPDMIVAADPPQTCGFAAALLAESLGVPLILDCLDLWPEAFIGAFPKPAWPLASFVLAPLRALRSSTFKKADAAVASCETYRQILIDRVPLSPARVTTIFLGVDAKELQPSGRSMDKPPGRTWAIYAGSLGNNHDIDAIVEAAKLLHDDPIDIIIAGDGPLRDRVTSAIAAGLSNVRYLGRVTPGDLAGWYAASDAGLIPYVSWSTVAMPVKIFDYLAAGLPLVSSLMGESADLIEQCQIGYRYQAGDAGSLAGVLRRVAGDPAERLRIAANARRCSRRFERDEQYERYADLVEHVASRRDYDPADRPI